MGGYSPRTRRKKECSREELWKKPAPKPKTTANKESKKRKIQTENSKSSKKRKTDSKNITVDKKKKAEPASSRPSNTRRKLRI